MSKIIEILTIIASFWAIIQFLYRAKKRLLKTYKQILQDKQFDHPLLSIIMMVKGIYSTLPFVIIFYIIIWYIKITIHPEALTNLIKFILQLK